MGLFFFFGWLRVFLVWLLVVFLGGEGVGELIILYQCGRSNQQEKKNQPLLIKLSQISLKDLNFLHVLNAHDTKTS